MNWINKLELIEMEIGTADLTWRWLQVIDQLLTKFIKKSQLLYRIVHQIVLRQVNTANVATLLQWRVEWQTNHVLLC